MATVEAICLIPLSVTKIIFLSFCPFSFIKKGTKGQNYLQNTTHKKLKIEQHESYKKPVMNSRAPEGQSVPAPLVTSAVYGPE